MSAPQRTISAEPDTSAAFFEHLYRSQPDPWNFAASPYEQHRYGRTIAALAGRHYTRAFEPGCSVGVLTALLSPLCDAVDAIDISPTAIAAAHRRCAHLPNITLHPLSLPAWLDIYAQPSLDLIVLSEIGYYFSADDLNHLASRLVRLLTPGGTLLAVHWLGSSPDHRLSGDEVHHILASQPDLRLDHSERHDTSPDPQQRFRLDRWSHA